MTFERARTAVGALSDVDCKGVSVKLWVKCAAGAVWKQREDEVRPQDLGPSLASPGESGFLVQVLQCCPHCLIVDFLNDALSLAVSLAPQDAHRLRRGKGEVKARTVRFLAGILDERR